ncbi:MAG: Rieske 2Fe-2S domain-containing protein [Pseudomonadales bacterium]|nr:Rieske 2Fe-2S domain-containing protein [Pseudomonadales bacterium]
MSSDNIIAKISSELPDRYARGWYCLGLSRFYGEEPKSLQYFGQKLVAYRGLEDYLIHILDAYCPHLGADLSKGCVNGNSLVCPFHEWSWGSDGVCNDIPYTDKIPQKARIKSWPTLEKNGLLYVWYDHEGNPPIPEQEIPEIEEYYSNTWTEWHMTEMTVQNNVRELIDNMADMAHFGPIHESPALSFKNIVEAHTYTQVMEGNPELMENTDSMNSRATYYGPAVMTTKMTHTSEGLTKRSRLLVTHVPIDHESFDLRFGLMVENFEGFSQDINDYIVQKYVDGTTESFLADAEIWHNKVRVDNPILCAGDGPVHKLRQWYEQFYVDISDVPEQLKQKKEYVVDIE